MRVQNIPVVDFSTFHGSTVAKNALINAIHQAGCNTGFLYLVNHGIDAALIDVIMRTAKVFFDQPRAIKEAISIRKSKHFRGYFGIGDELLDAQSNQGDYKEGIKIGRDLPDWHPLVQKGLPLHGPNQWPDNTHLRCSIKQYMQACQNLGEQLMSVFAVALGEHESYFADMLTEPMVTLAPLHYPPTRDADRYGAAVHTDYGCLTLVYQQTEGLEIYDRIRNSWIVAPVIPDSLIVNIGDMLQRWSNDTYQSTQHRVVNRTGTDRYSLAFFYDPNFDAVLQPMAGCVNETRPNRYTILTAGEYLLERMNSSFATGGA